MEDFLLEKIDRRRLAKLSNLDYLGLDMVEAGIELFESVFIFTSNCSPLIQVLDNSHFCNWQKLCGSIGLHK